MNKKKKSYRRFVKQSGFTTLEKANEGMNTISEKNSLTGFTLIELMIVIFVLAILAAIAIPNYVNSRDKAKVAAAKDSLNTIIKGITMYYIEYGRYPADSTLSNMSSISILSDELANADAYLNQFYDGKIQDYKSPPATPGDNSPFEILIRTKAGVRSDGKVGWLYYSEARDLNEIWVSP